MNAISAVQLIPTASVDAQFVFDNLNPLDALNAKPARSTGPVLVSVTVCVLLVMATPVVVKVTTDGCICTAPALPPIPFRITNAEFDVVDVIVSAPAAA